MSIGTAYRYRDKVLDSEGNVSSVSATSADYTAVGVGTSDLVANSVTAGILAATITISNTFQTGASIAGRLRRLGYPPYQLRRSDRSEPRCIDRDRGLPQVWLTPDL